MEIVLLGTGGADGWPNPWCTCASCTSMRARGEVRAQSGALVDGRLLLDLGPDVPRSALRHGRSLAGVRHVLVTHAHPDHCEPAALMWRTWTPDAGPLDLVGPPAVLARCATWTGAGSPVRARTVHAGDRLTVGEYDVRVLPAAHGGPAIGPAVLYDVTGPDGARLLWATDTAPLPAAAWEATAGAAYDVVLLEESFGDRPVPGQDHHSLDDWGHTVAELRRRGAVTDTTRLVAIHLTHGNPPPPELDRRLAAYGGEAPPDGTVLSLRGTVPSLGGTAPSVGAAVPDRGTPRRVLVLGGARSGKSREAERRLQAEPAVTYVATAPERPNDVEWTGRVAAHRARRPPDWTTVETGAVAPLLREATGAVLVDDLGLWLTRALDAAGWQPAGVTAASEELVAAWRATTAYAVLVSPEVGAGVVPERRSGRVFRDLLGRLNGDLAAEADEVWLVTAGIARRLR